MQCLCCYLSIIKGARIYMKAVRPIAAMLLAAAVSLALCSCANDSPDPAVQTTATAQTQSSEDMTTAGEEAVTTETSVTGESLTTVAEGTETPETKTTEESPAAEAYVQVLLDGEWLTVLFPMDHDLPIEYTTLEAGSELSLGADCMELPSGEYRIIQGYTLSDSTVGCARCEFEID